MLLTQNRELKRDGVWNWTLPAWVIQLDDGSHMNVCPIPQNNIPHFRKRLDGRTFSQAQRDRARR